MKRMQNLPIPHAPLVISLSEIKCSSILCQPHKIHSRTIPFIIPSKGVWGLAPMIKKSP